MENRIKQIPNREQQEVLFLCIEDYVSKDHIVRHIREFIKTKLDLSSLIQNCSVNSRGKLGGGYQYPPLEMFSTLIYSYIDGNFSSRKVEELCKTDFRYKFLMSNMTPDHSTIARFRSEHEKEFNNIFIQVVNYAIDNNYTSLEKIAIDGTVFKSASSRRHNYSIDSLLRKIKNTKDLLNELNKLAQEVETEDESKQVKKKIEKAEQTLNECVELKPLLIKAHEEVLKETHRDKSQVKGPYFNIKEHHSRIMMNKTGGFDNGTNCQIAVSKKNQIIINTDVFNIGSDQKAAIPFLKSTGKLYDLKGSKIIEDAGYLTRKNVKYGIKNGIDLYISPVKGWKLTDFLNNNLKKAKSSPKYMQEFLENMHSQTSIEILKERSGIVEPVFGKFRSNFNFNRYNMLGYNKKKAEMDIISTAYNIRRLISLILKRNAPLNNLVLQTISKYWHGKYHFKVYLFQYVLLFY